MTLPAPITRAQTVALIRQMRAKTTSSAECDALEQEAVTGNLRFCWTVAKQYAGHGVEMDDLFAEATAALLHALRRFDPDRKTSFPEYLKFCLRQVLIRAVRRQGSPVAVPRTVNVDPETVSLDHQPETVSERMLGEPEQDPAEAALSRVDAERLNREVDALSDREASVVRMRYGLAGIAPHELSEIGTVLDITKQRVAAILAQALAKLRKRMRPAA